MFLDVTVALQEFIVVPIGCSLFHSSATFAVMVLTLMTNSLSGAHSF
jgi:hypothetical protein